ncbi:glycerophosphodiester phosphodiesterase [bacterium]|nr:glycerophosphodiester phosphodiesterase [bacterium]
MKTGISGASLIAGAVAAALALAACATPSPQQKPGAKEKDTIMSNPKNVVVMAHRGFRGIAPENTLEAAQKGYESGAEYWETDVAASSDGTLVIMHDDNLARTTDARAKFPGRSPWTVYDFSLAELKSLDAGSWYAAADQFKQIAAGRVTQKDLASFAGIKVPTFAEALELTKKNGWKINVEIKDATGRACDPWIVEKTAETIRSLGMQNSVVVSSFNHEYLVRMKKAAPEIRVAALIDRPIPDPVGQLKRIGAMALNPNYKYLDEATVQAVRKAGFDVFVWTPNEKADMERLVGWGVTGLITDFPDRALEVLGRKAGR